MPPDTRPPYTVLLKRDPEHLLRRLPADLRRRLQRAINALADDPRHAGVVAVKGLASVYRVRVGDWRIVYQVKDDVLIVLVLEIAPRGEVYRKLGR